MKMRALLYALLSPVGIGLLMWGLFSENPVMSGVLVGIGTVIMGLSAAKVVPLLSQGNGGNTDMEIEWRDERNKAIREKAAWVSGIILMAVMAVSALLLTLIDQLVGACVIAGLLLLYSVSILVFSAYFSKKL